MSDVEKVFSTKRGNGILDTTIIMFYDEKNYL